MREGHQEHCSDCFSAFWARVLAAEVAEVAGPFSSPPFFRALRFPSYGLVAYVLGGGGRAGAGPSPTPLFSSVAFPSYGLVAYV